jgi:hypothetical protein
MTELTMFLYPWDAQRDGVAETVERVRALGVTRIAVAATYHSAEVVTPRAGGPYMVHVEANRAHVPLAEDAFTGLRLSQSAFSREFPGCFGELAAGAADASVGMTAWVICLHNSSLAQQHPEAALENCAGDRSAHGLCPANPDVARYVRELASAVAGTGVFDRILLESASYLLAGHGHPHELMAIRLDVRTRFLLSLCFCASCVEEAHLRDIDAEALRARCSELLETAWGSPLLARRAPDDGLELAALLATDPEIGAYARMRLAVVSRLVERVVADSHRRGLAVSVATAVWGRPSPLNWVEGIDLGATATTADQLTVTTYQREPEDVARDLDHVLESVAAERVMQLNTLWPEHHDGVEALLAKVRAGLDAGVREFGLYNLAMTPPAMLGWARAVGDLVASA